MSVTMVVAWLWMAHMRLEQVKWCLKDSQCSHALPYVQTAPPAEHVIEIKTRRERHKACESGDLADEYGCFALTREIWIDGARWGLLNED